MAHHQKVRLGYIGVNCTGRTDDSGPFWANSNTQTGDDPQCKSKRIWIDGDITNGIMIEGIAMHIVDFGSTDGAFTDSGGLTTNPVAEQWSSNTELLCRATPRMRFYGSLAPDEWPEIYQPPLKYNINGTDKDPNQVINGTIYIGPKSNKRKVRRSKRRGSGRFSQMESTVVHSASNAHSVEQLCNSLSSVSPDFVSYAERKFCNMSTRVLWSLCSTNVTTGCFDTNSNVLAVDAKAGTDNHPKFMAAKRDRRYDQIVHW
jgi:hypothetical protein